MTTIILPKKVRKGATIGFFSPSDPIYPRRIRFIKLGVKILNDWGYSTEGISDKTLEDWSTLRPVNVRTDEFHEKLEDRNIDILIATWGGKNSSDLLPHLNHDLIRNSRKPIIGTSDIAVLLNAITSCSRLITYHGPNVLGKLNQTSEVGFPLLQANIGSDYKFLPFSSEREIHILQEGSSSGRLVGGSLGTFTLGLSGTKYMPDFDKIIFFFESASLDYFRTRQHLQHLNITGFINRVVGVIIGAMTKIDESSDKYFYRMILDLFPAPVPIIKCNLFGHGLFYNPTFPIGMLAKMDTRNRVFHLIPERNKD